MNSTSGKKAIRGFTLIEVLVAVLILATGATGVAAMQLHALRAARESGLQSDALQLAADLSELVRIYGDAELFDYDAAGDTAPSALSACTGRACEFAAWKQRMRNVLPRPRAVLCRDSAPASGDALRWTCDGATPAPLVIKIGWSSADTAPGQGIASPSLVLAAEH